MSSSQVIRRALCAGLFASIAAGQPPRVPTRSTLEWIPFHWQGDSIGGRWVEHAALFVPVTIAGLTGDSTAYLQLDTGAGWTQLYGVPYDQLLAAQSRSDTLPYDSVGADLTITGRVGPYRFQSESVAVLKRFGDSIQIGRAHQLIGTLGLRFFRHRVLILDFPRQRLAILESGTPLPSALATRVQYVPAHYQHGHLFVTLQLGDTTRDDFFYDTGASFFEISTTPETWKMLTSRTGREPDNLVLRERWWGTYVSMIGARSMVPLRLGPIRVPHPMVFSEAPDDTVPDFFARAPYHVGGYLGNTLFTESTVIVDLSNDRLGVIR